MTELLQSLSDLITQNFWLAPLLALLAGMVTSLTPCCLSSIPLVIGIVGGTDQGPKRSLALSLTFAAGSAVTLTALGVGAALAGRLMGASSKWWYLLLGVLMVLMALQTWEIFSIIPQRMLASQVKKTGYIGAFLAGILGGVFASPCATPVLVALLAMVAQKGNLLWGVALLLLYSIGHGVLAVVTGTSIGFVKKLMKSPAYQKWTLVFKILMGGAILLIGFYMFYLGF